MHGHTDNAHAYFWRSVILIFMSMIRCSENRMDASSLAVVIAPNLLQCPPCKLTLDTEKHLDQQTSVIKSLILHADRIGKDVEELYEQLVNWPFAECSIRLTNLF